MTGLQVRDLTKSFGGIVALDDVSFDVRPGEIMGLIGPNGAGKTTVFNCISRLYDPDRGSIIFDGHDLLRMHAQDIVNVGVARTFQNVELFRTMSVLDNLLVGQHYRMTPRWARSWLERPTVEAVDVATTRIGGGWTSLVSRAVVGLLNTVPYVVSAVGEATAYAVRPPWVARDDALGRQRALEVIEFLGLGHVKDLPPADLPFGIQKRVELARALVASPKLILLDEPAGGLSHRELDELGEVIRRVRDEFEVTVLLVEHHMELVMSVSDRVCVLNFGRKIADGTPAEVQKDPAVIESYLGE